MVGLVSIHKDHANITKEIFVLDSKSFGFVEWHWNLFFNPEIFHGWKSRREERLDLCQACENRLSGGPYFGPYPHQVPRALLIDSRLPLLCHCYMASLPRR